jgi:purine-binding chemotaxis protein CheW
VTDSATAGSGEPDRALVVDVGTERIAIPIEQVREVVFEPQVSRLPTAPASVLGLIAVRGEVLALFDPAALLGFGGTTSVEHAVVLDVDGERAAIAVGPAPAIVELGDRAGDSGLAAGLGVHHAGGALATVVDTTSLFGRDSGR